MKTKLFIFILFLSLTGRISAQSDRKEVKEIEAVIANFFEGMHKGDTAQIKTSFAKDAIFQRLYLEDSKNVRLNFDDFLKNVAQKDPKSVWKEDILSYKINSDGTVANAWTPYNFYINGKFSHCGYNSFQLFKMDGSWKIVFVLYDVKKQKCFKN